MASIFDEEIGDYLKAQPYKPPKLMLLFLIFYNNEILTICDKDSELPLSEFALPTCDVFPNRNMSLGYVLQLLRSHCLSLSPRAFFIAPDALRESTMPHPLDRKETAWHPTITVRIDIIDVAGWRADETKAWIFGNFCPKQHILYMATQEEVMNARASSQTSALVALDAFERTPSEEEVALHYAEVDKAQAAKKEREETKFELFRAQLKEDQKKAKMKIRRSGAVWVMDDDTDTPKAQVMVGRNMPVTDPSTYMANRGHKRLGRTTVGEVLAPLNVAQQLFERNNVYEGNGKANRNTREPAGGYHGPQGGNRTRPSQGVAGWSQPEDAWNDE